MFVGSIIQQPNDVMDYDVDFSDWLPPGDVVMTAAVTSSPAGLTVGYAISNPRVKVWVRGGTTGTTYKVTILANTNDGRSKEVELKIKVKDY